MKNDKGFTLVELIIIMVIIATLAIIAIPQFANYRGRAYNDAMVSDLRTAITCQEAYFTDHQRYAGSADENVLKTQYNMYESQGVDVVIIDVVDPNKFEIEARHASTATIYVYSGPGGSIAKK
jgi:prepilin-type N-terminal cleavage/methylation domain-containing protein